MIHAHKPRNQFQFTPLREGRPDSLNLSVDQKYFNSRPSARGDADAAIGSAQIKISIHAPPRGATVKVGSQDIAGIFQFTPLREGRRRHGAQAPRPRNFNSRPSARGDRKGRQSRHSWHISIHAPPRGATTARSASATPTEFQFTPLREGRRWRPSRTCRPTNFNSRPSARGDKRSSRR